MRSDIILPQVIFFDWDGTLADSYKFLESAHNHVRENLGLPKFSDDEFKNYFGHPREKLYVELYGDHVEQAKILFGGYVTKNHMEQLKPIDGAQDLVKTIHELGVTMGIISNKKAEFLQREIRGFGWDGYFRTIVGAGDAAHDKPAADPLIMAAKAIGRTTMEHIWYAGDTDVDLQCAKNAGCDAVFLAHDTRSDEWTKLYKPFLIFKNCRSMAEFLLQCPKNRLKTN